MDQDDFISKTRRKRQATEIQDVGADLVKLSGEQLARIEMPESLRQAVTECRRLTTHEAIRRQKQYIGKLMRNIDSAPIAEQLAAMHAPSQKQTALLHLAEKWRVDMLADAEALERFVKEFPGADARALHELIIKARAEAKTDKPPKFFRQLFHAVNGSIQAHAKKET
jgi:ribosome-associated protein